MSDNLPENFVASPAQPTGVEIHLVDDVFVKQMVIPEAGMYIPQHAHVYDHLSMLAVGSVKVWADGVYLGIREAPCGIVIAAHVKHTFQSLIPGTIIYCIHNGAKFGPVAEIESEHNLVGV